MGGFTEVSTGADFFANPTRRYLVRPHFAYLGADDELLSLVIWGHIGQRDIGDLLQVFGAAALRPKQRDALVQMQAVVGIEEEALRHLAAFFLADPQRAQRVTRREAVVRPSGSMGMIVAGFYQIALAIYPTSVFERRAEALAWLGRGAETELAAFSDELIERGKASRDIAYRLREHLARDPSAATLETAAAELGTSTRTLQRRLRDAGASFEDEQKQARLAMAKNLLLRTDFDIKRIALEVGLPSGERLSQVFRELAGTTPSEWRKEHER